LAILDVPTNGITVAHVRIPKSLAVRCACVFALQLLLCGNSTASEASDAQLSERDFFGELPALFSVARLPQAPADAPGAVTVIDREIIRASGARDVAELFRLVPGFQVGFASGGKEVVGYHGLTGQYSQRMQVLLDGRSLHAPYILDGVDWSNLPVNLDDIDRIEVLRGSNSAIYGANAFLGVANIITRSAAQSVGKYAEVHAGTAGIFDLAARLGSGTEDVRFRASAGHREDNGLAGAFDSRNISYGSLRADLQLSATDQLSLQFGANSNSLETGSRRNAGDPERVERTEAYFGSVRWQRTFSHDHELSLSCSTTYEQVDDDFTIRITPTSGLAIDYGRRALRNQLEYQEFVALDPHWRVSWGAEARGDWLNAPQLFSSSSTQRTYAVRGYVNAEYRPSPSWTVNFGGLVERATISGGFLAPRLVANWKFSPEQTLRLGYSTAFRTPSLFEQRSDWRYVYQGQTIDIRYLSRGGLRPEKVDVTELSYLGDWSRNGMVFDARVFRERVTEIITQQIYSLPAGTEFDPKSDAYDLRNADSANLLGVEGQLRYRPSANQLWLAGGNVARRTASTNAIADSIPRYGAHALGSIRFPSDFNASIAYYLSAPIRWLGEPVGIGAGQRLDLKLEKVFRIGPTRASIALVSQALLGNLTEFKPSQQFTRRYWLAVSVEY
jgi:iron complex outermembrane receptor protein